MKHQLLAQLGICLLLPNVLPLQANHLRGTKLPNLSPTLHPTYGIKKYIVVGTIKDSEGQAIVGANVRVEGTTQSAGTDQKGVFRLTLSQKGMRRLHVSHVGYQSVRKQIQVGENPIKIDFVLAETDTHIEEAVIVGAHYERALKDAPVITRIVSRCEIDRINPLDLTQLLQYSLPGLQITFDPRHNGTSLTYQGMGSRTVVFLVDGERMNGEGIDQNIDFNRINPDEVERIEIVRGAASSMYESNAMGAVINIITRQATRPLSVTTNGRYAGKYGQKYGVNVGVKRGKFSSFTAIGHRQRDTYTVKDEKSYLVETQDTLGNKGSFVEETNTASVPGYKIWDLTQRFVCSPTDNWSFELKGAYYNNKQPLRNQGKRYDVYEDFNLGMKSTMLFNEKQKMDFSYTTDTYQKHYNYTLSHTSETPYKNHTQSARVAYVGDFEDFTLAMGMEWYRENLRHYMNKGENKAATKWSYYVQDEFNVSQAIKVVASLRLEKAYSYSLRYLPKFSILYRPTSALTLRANYADGYRAPSLKERFQDYAPFSGHPLLLGNQQLTPESSRQISASLEYRLDQLTLMANAYYNKYWNYIGMRLTQDALTRTIVAQYHNSNDKKTTGIEASARYQTPAWLFNLTYNYINDHEVQNGYNISNIRPHTLTFGASYRCRLQKNLYLLSSLNGTWGAAFSSYNLENNGRSYEKYNYDARTILSLNVGLQLPKSGLTASVQVENLLNYVDKAATSTTQIPNPGRIYALSIGMNLSDLLKF